MAEQRMLQAISRLNKNGAPHKNNCTVVLGDGTMKVDFKNGRAEVPLGLARLLDRDPNIDIIGLEAAPAAPQPAEPEPQPAAADSIVDAAATTIASDDAAAASDVLSDEVKAAIEHLRAEGLDVPDVVVSTDGDTPPAAPAPPAAREGFEETTSDGQPRCQAAKGNGQQCANAQVSGGPACALLPHKGQFPA